MNHLLPGMTPSAPDDRGDPDPELAAALAADDRVAVHARLPHARLLVPVVAMPHAAGDNHGAGDNNRAGGEADMAVPTLVNAAGRRGLPVFSALAALTDWRPDARPVPVAGARVIAAALEERYDGLVIDVAGPAPFVLEPAELRLLVGLTHKSGTETGPDC